MDGAAVPEGYAALRKGAAFCVVPGAAIVTVTGPDAVRFVDGFTTAHVAARAPGESCEGMILDGRGQVLMLVHYLVRGGDAGVVIAAFSGTGFDLAAHLERYHIREQLAIADVSADWEAIVVAGPATPACVAGQPDGADALRDAPARRSAVTRLAGVGVAVIGTPGVLPGGHLLLVPAGATAAVEGALASGGAVRAGAAAVDTVRIEEGYPLPQDIPDRTLPQELGRDERAISFTKGCYLGQETVARIDALGHVNRRLVRLVGDGFLPARGAAVHLVRPGVPDEVVGMVSSACWSPRFHAGLALAIVAVRGLSGGACLTVAGRPVRPVDLPDSGGR
jgi:folate-binding protein YgfZ